jgi:hypothetical protein
MVLVGDMPTAADDATALRGDFTDGRGAHQAGLVLVGGAIVPLLLFAIGVHRINRGSDRPQDEGWSAAAGTFFVFGAALYSVGLVIDAGLLLSSDAGLSDGALLALWDISVASNVMMALGFGVAAACASISVLTHGTRPSWYGWLGVLVGIAGVLGLAGLASDSDTASALGFVMFPLFAIWTVVMSFFLYREA